MTGTFQFRLPGSRVEALTLEFTHDRALMDQYLGIYEREFRSTHDVPGYRSIRSEHDSRGFILIARQGELCVGGARLSVKTEVAPIPWTGIRVS